MNKKYLTFLNSPEWKVISAAKKEEDGNKCQVCGSQENLEVHHKTYDLDPMKGLLSFDNLVTLCKDCHLSAHGYRYGMRQFDGPICEYCGTRFPELEQHYQIMRTTDNQEIIIPIYVGGDRIGEVVTQNRTQFRSGNPAADVVAPPLPIKKQR